MIAKNKSRAEQSRAETETESSQNQVTLWRNEYDALAMLYSQIRTEHLDLLSTCKELQLKASAQTTAGEFVHGHREQEQSRD
jgi:hypothetical protein